MAPPRDLDWQKGIIPANECSASMICQRRPDRAADESIFKVYL
jgi:hypothetical protein